MTSDSIEQCPTCGRCGFNDIETKKTDTGSKAQQTTLTETAAKYISWRYKFGSPYYVGDVDQVEWRPLGGALVPIGVLELTRVPGNRHVPANYRRSIHNRFFSGTQAERSLHVADKLGCDAYIVLFRWDLTAFWVYNMTIDARKEWYRYSQNGYASWIQHGLQHEWKQRA